MVELTQKLPVEKMEVDGKRVKLQKTPEEIILGRQSYRKEYRTRPHVLQKRVEKANDPKQINKRKEYAKDPKVKERKKLQGKQKRRMFRAFKAKHPEVFQKLKEDISKEIPTEIPSMVQDKWVPKEAWVTEKDLKHAPSKNEKKTSHSSTTTSESTEESSSYE